MYEGGVIAVGKTDSAHTALDGPGVIPLLRWVGGGASPFPLMMIIVMMVMIIIIGDHDLELLTIK